MHNLFIIACSASCFCCFVDSIFRGRWRDNTAVFGHAGAKRQSAEVTVFQRLVEGHRETALGWSEAFLCFILLTQF